MSEATLAALEEAVTRGDEPDDVLRSTVSLLASEAGVVWAGIAFREAGELALGPAAGEPDPSRRLEVPVAFEGAEVGRLWVDGDADRRMLERVVTLVAPYVLIGWDTGGRAWEP